MIFQFNQITLDTARFRLQQSGHPVAVEPQVFDLLAYLIEHRDRVVTRSELLETLWKNRVVTDSALSARIKDARKAIGDNGQKQAIIKTVFGRGYQFVASTTAKESTPGFSKPQTRYAQNGDIGLAYQVFGEGPVDLIMVPGWLSNLDLFWQQPRAVHFFLELAKFSRVILIDRRGTGLSDRVTPPGLDGQVQDLAAVMTAAGSRRAVLYGNCEAGNICAQFAYTHPRQTRALILNGVAARWVRSDDYPYGPSVEDAEQWVAEVENAWGGPVGLDVCAPSLADDEAFREWFSMFLRSSASRATALALLRLSYEMDSCPILGSIRVPTLILQATGDLTCPYEAGLDIAQRIPNAKFVEIDANDHIPFVGNPEMIVREIGAFIAGLGDS